MSERTPMNPKTAAYIMLIVSIVMGIITVVWWKYHSPMPFKPVPPTGNYNVPLVPTWS